jgi:hypothetical protein
VKVGIATPSPIRRRVERVIAAEPGVRVVDLAATDRVDIAAVHGPVPDHVEAGMVVPMPIDPLPHLAGLLAGRACAAAGTDRADYTAVTTPGTELGGGVAVTFPPPVGALWARREGDHLVAPVAGDLAAIAVAATGPRGAVRLGAVDVHDFLVAIALAAPVMAAITGRDELDTAVTAGLEFAEFVATT